MIAWTVRNAAPIFVMILATLLFGLWSYISLPRESAPDIKVPFIMVITPYVGVSPKDIESLVSVPLENELAGVKGLKTMRSTSAEGVSSVFMEFEPDVDIEDALQKVRDRVNRAKTELPEDAEEPQVRELSFSDIPVMIVTVAGPQDETVLKKLVEDLEDEVSRIPGVLEAEVSGGTEREFQVLVDPGRLLHYGLTLNDVVGALQAENVNIPGGDVRVGEGNVLLRVPAELKRADQLEEAPVADKGGRIVHVRDVARVVDTLADRTTYARMNGQAAVSLNVKKRTGANIVSVADEVKKAVEVQAARWPKGVEYRILADQSKAIRSMVQELQDNILTALILVIGVILVSMGFRNSLLVGMAIPMSMFASFAVLSALGFTLNMVVLFSLILALGMLVDNAIVITENGYRHLSLGKTKWQAAIDATNEMAWPVLGSTATTVVAFLPLVFWDGIMGQFMGYMPKTVIIVLTASMVFALLILPMLMSRFLKANTTPLPPNETEAEALARIDEEERRQFENPGRVMAVYKAVLDFAIRWRYLSFGGGLFALVATFVIYGVFNHGTEFFPATEPDRAVIAVRAPDGTDLATTDRIVRRVEGILAKTQDVDVFVSEVGVAAGNGGGLVGSSSSPQSAKITVDFLPHPAVATKTETPRSRSSDLTVLELRAAVAQLAGAVIEVGPEEQGPPVGNDIEVKVKGDDFALLGETAQRLKRQIAALDGVDGLSDDYRVNRPELAVRIDRTAAKQAGVSTGLVGSTVRTAVAGATATTVRDGEEEYDVIVKIAPEFTEDVQSVLSLRMPGRQERDPNVYMVPLGAVASYDLAGGTGALQRIDQELTVTVIGDVKEGVPVNEKQAEVKALLANFDWPAGVAYEIAGSSDEQNDAAAFLGWAMLVALVLIVLVLVLQFNDLVQPLIIMVTVLLSLIGVLWGLLLTGTPFGVMMTGIGVISLAGVVVNNAIVLLDYVNQLRKDGHDVRTALLRSGMTRFRPVMLTAITTVLGLLPMAVGWALSFGIGWAGPVPYPTVAFITGAPSSAFWGPMAVAVIFGLAFATVLTLVMVPTLYGIYHDVYTSLSSFGTRRAKLPAAAVPKVAAVGVGIASLAVPEVSEAANLQEVWAAAEQHNPDLAIVREGTFQARNQRIRAWALIGPSVSAQGQYSYLSYGDVLLDFGAFFEPFEAFLPPDFVKPEPTVVQRGSNFDGSLTVQQPLFNGQAFPLLVGAYRSVDAAVYDEARTVQQVRAGIARAFYGLLAAREAVGLSEGALKNANTQLDLARRQVDAGLATERANLQAQLRVAQAERDLRRTKEQLAGAQEAFSKLTGLPGDTSLEGGFVRDLPSSLDDAQRRAIEARPDLLAARTRAEVAHLQVRAEQMGWLPNVNARWTGIANQTEGFAGQKTYWQAAVTANWTLWDGGARVAATRAAASQQRQAQLSAEKVELDVGEQVRVAWEAYDRAKVAIAAVDREVTLARDSLDLAKRGFEAGTVTFLEVEQAELGLRGSELSRLNEKIGLDLAAIDLLVALGEL
jgi:multidrug efflux pump subunit AcrB/outer membrane protein TolC